jgi:enamine deaminase RidA (YjgF/YER057c/UK114 family)
MRKRIFPWLGREFIELSGEAKAAGSAGEQAREVFLRFDQELRDLGLSLDNTVRSRLWGRDRESRDQGSTERVGILSGARRSASSSYISPTHFDGAARVAVDLLAMRPSSPGLSKQLVEYEPVIVPLRYLVYDSIVVLSGVTTVLPTLDGQIDSIVDRIEQSLRDSGSSWDRVVKIAFYLHRSQTVQKLNQLFHERVSAGIPWMEYEFVDGYSSPGKLCEIEVTAKV